MWSNGKLNGLKEYYYDDGKKLAEEMYEDGAIISGIKYFRNGKVREKMTLNPFKIEKYYSRTGKLKNSTQK